MKRVIQHMPILEYLRSLTSKEQKNLILNAPKQLLLTLSEIALNLIGKNIVLTKPQISKLQKHEKQILELSERKHSLSRRKQILRGGSFLKNLLDTTILQLMLAIVRNKSNGVRHRAKKVGKKVVPSDGK